MVYMSTAYSNCNKEFIEEKFYPPHLSGENAIKLLNCLDEQTLDDISKS